MHKSDRRKLYTSHKFRPLTPPGSIRPRGVKRRKSQKGGWLHKTPGAEKTKKPKRVARGLLRLFRLFRTGSVFSHPPASGFAGEAGEFGLKGFFQGLGVEVGAVLGFEAVVEAFGGGRHWPARVRREL